MLLTAFAALLLLADAGTSRTPLRGPLKASRPQKSEFELAQLAATISNSITSTKSFSGRFTVVHEAGIGRVVVSLYGRAAWPSRAKEWIEEVLKQLPFRPDPYAVRFVYFFDGPCSGENGYELLRLHDGHYVERQAPRVVNGIRVLVPLVGAIDPCMDLETPPPETTGR